MANDSTKKALTLLNFPGCTFATSSSTKGDSSFFKNMFDGSNSEKYYFKDFDQWVNGAYYWFKTNGDILLTIKDIMNDFNSDYKYDQNMPLLFRFIMMGSRSSNTIFLATNWMKTSNSSLIGVGMMSGSGYYLSSNSSSIQKFTQLGRIYINLDEPGREYFQITSAI